MPPSRKKRRGGNKGDRDFYAHNSDDDVRLSQEEASDSDDGSPQMGPPSSSLRSRTDNMSDFQKRKAAIDSTYDSMNPRPSGARQTMGGSRPKVKPSGPMPPPVPGAYQGLGIPSTNPGSGNREVGTAGYAPTSTVSQGSYPSTPAPIRHETTSGYEYNSRYPTADEFEAEYAYARSNPDSFYPEFNPQVRRTPAQQRASGQALSRAQSMADEESSKSGQKSRR